MTQVGTAFSALRTVCFLGFVLCSTGLQPAIAHAQDKSANQCGKILVWNLPDGGPPAFHGPDSLAVRRDYWIRMTKGRLTEVAYAAERWCRKHGSYPSSLTDLMESARGLGPRDRCRMFPELLSDAWDHRIHYHLVSGIPDLRSAGPDGRFGTVDDISLPRKDDSLAMTINGALCDATEGSP